MAKNCLSILCLYMKCLERNQDFKIVLQVKDSDTS